ncbi:MAG: response regulator [Desulfatiglandaceae bacterium]|jgi:CheY-like chemotaxis protein
MNNETKETILVVEDDVDVLSMIIKHLEYLGYRVISARDGMEGLKMVEAGGYDLVITDIVMPYVSGVGVVTALKTGHPNIPVIAITGYGKEPEAVALEKKADVVLSKPVRMAVLKDHMARLLVKAP